MQRQLGGNHVQVMFGSVILSRGISAAILSLMSLDLATAMTNPLLLFLSIQVSTLSKAQARSNTFRHSNSILHTLNTTLPRLRPSGKYNLTLINVHLSLLLVSNTHLFPPSSASLTYN
jgi:hypothetical protein